MAAASFSHLLLQRKRDVLGMMRTGALNLLVATAVAEEGLDLPACCLVLRFDLPVRYAPRCTGMSLLLEV